MATKPTKPTKPTSCPNTSRQAALPYFRRAGTVNLVSRAASASELSRMASAVDSLARVHRSRLRSLYADSIAGEFHAKTAAIDDAALAVLAKALAAQLSAAFGSGFGLIAYGPSVPNGPPPLQHRVAPEPKAERAVGGGG